MDAASVNFTTIMQDEIAQFLQENREEIIERVRAKLSELNKTEPKPEQV